MFNLWPIVLEADWSLIVFKVQVHTLYDSEDGLIFVWSHILLVLHIPDKVNDFIKMFSVWRTAGAEQYMNERADILDNHSKYKNQVATLNRTIHTKTGAKPFSFYFHLLMLFQTAMCGNQPLAIVGQ